MPLGQCWRGAVGAAEAGDGFPGIAMGVRIARGRCSGAEETVNGEFRADDDA